MMMLSRSRRVNTVLEILGTARRLHVSTYAVGCFDGGTAFVRCVLG